MISVTVIINGKDRRVGAMVKALAVEVAGFEAVKGTTKEFLSLNGFYKFHFPTEHHAADFRGSVEKYIPKSLAECRLPPSN